MKLLDDLRREHELVENMVGSLRTYVARRAAGSAPSDDAAGYLRFFRLYAGRYHHAREEQVLFPALIQETEVPADHGPIAVLLEDHHAMATTLEELAPLLVADREGGGDARLGSLVERYGKALLRHIDAENSVLFTESEARFKRAGISELADRAPDAEELAARGDGERLVLAHPPSDFPDLIRGDGCMACEAYGTRCDGVEREWWSDVQWEDFFHQNDD